VKQGLRRVVGRPTSSNGASSFHLRWEFSQPLRAVRVAAIIEVTQEPSVAELYFWALGVEFVRSDGESQGGAHLGLQWLPTPPGPILRAANWGGYYAPDLGGAELPGSESRLSAADGINTRCYPWEAHRRYELVVLKATDVAAARRQGWVGTIVSADEGDSTVVRTLYLDADYIGSVSVWSEVFAPCEAPTSAVKWSEFRAWDVDGLLRTPDHVRVTYQSEEAGGCSNTDAIVRDSCFEQRTATERSVAHDTRLPIDSSR